MRDLRVAEVVKVDVVVKVHLAERHTTTPRLRLLNPRAPSRFGGGGIDPPPERDRGFALAMRSRRCVSSLGRSSFDATCFFLLPSAAPAPLGSPWFPLAPLSRRSQGKGERKRERRFRLLSGVRCLPPFHGFPPRLFLRLSAETTLLPVVVRCSFRVPSRVSISSMFSLPPHPSYFGFTSATVPHTDRP